MYLYSSNAFFFLTLLFWFSWSSVSSGTKIEGILRQAADVEEVERRVQEYEQGTYNVLMLL